MLLNQAAKARIMTESMVKLEVHLMAAVPKGLDILRHQRGSGLHGHR